MTAICTCSCSTKPVATWHLVATPAKVGTRVQDIPGIAGDQLVHDIVAQAQHGPGWVEYDITNPSTGVVQTKMSL